MNRQQERSTKIQSTGTQHGMAFCWTKKQIRCSRHVGFDKFDFGQRHKKMQVRQLEMVATVVTAWQSSVTRFFVHHVSRNKNTKPDNRTRKTDIDCGVGFCLLLLGKLCVVGFAFSFVSPFWHPSDPSQVDHGRDQAIRNVV